MSSLFLKFFSLSELGEERLDSNYHNGFGAGRYISTCPIARASKSQIRASILKDQEITVARIGQAKSVL